MRSCATSSGMNKRSKTRRCAICGVEYEICVSCEKINGWRVHTDTAEHYEYLCILMEYKVQGDAEKAYKALAARGFDFNKIDSFQPAVKVLAEEIFFAVTAAGEKTPEEKGNIYAQWQGDNHPVYL